MTLNTNSTPDLNYVFPDLDSQIFNEVLSQTWRQVRLELRSFANLPESEVLDKLRLAFGASFSEETALNIIQNWRNDNWEDVPSVEFLSDEILKGARGAFAQSTGKIYLAKELLETQSLEQVVAVLLEEYGHYVDSKINTVDADGDEGDIFYRLVRGLEITEPELDILKAEDDIVTININNTEIIAEANFDPFIPTFEDFLDFDFDHQSNEISLKLGNLFLEPLIEKQPVYWIKNTKYNKEKVHNYQYYGINSNGIRIGLSYQREKFEQTYLFGIKRIGDVNIDASATISAYVNSNHEIIADTPKAVSRDHSSTSGIYTVADVFVSSFAWLLDFFATGDINYTSSLKYILDVGAAIYNIYDTFSNDILAVITDPTQRNLIQRGGPLANFINNLYGLDDQQPDLYLGDIRFEEGKGIWLVWNYQEWIEDLVEDVIIKPLDNSFNLVGVDSGLSLSPPPNRNPVAIANTLFDDDAFNEDDSNYRNITNILLSNDKDYDSDAITITSVNTSGTKGSVSLRNGQVYYKPNGKFDDLLPSRFALDRFEYTISDGRGGTDTTWVSIKIHGANDLPTAVNDTVRIKSNSWGEYLRTELKANDYDPDKYERLNITNINTTGTKGTVTLSNGSVRYDPDDKFNGLGSGEFANDYFSYTITDKAGATDTATVTVVIEGVNGNPVAEDDEFEINEDSNGLDVTSILLSNDSDPNTNDTISIISVNYRSVTLNNGVVTYTPGSEFQDVPLGETDIDYFTYVISDGKGGTDTGYVQVTVTGSNDAPIAGDDLIEINENSRSPILWNVDDNDSDPDFLETYELNFVSFDDTDSKGEVSFYEGFSGTKYLQYDSKGQFDYLGVGETTTDRFSYTIEDPHGLQDTANVVLKIIGENDAPIAGDDAVTVNENDGAIDITNLVLSNDSDVDNDTLNIGVIDENDLYAWSYRYLEGVVEVINGRLTYNPHGQFEYLAEGETDTDTFYYLVTDDYGAVDRGKVTVTIEGDNDKPVANDDTVTVSEDETWGDLLISIDDNDTDEDKYNLEIISLDDTNTQGEVSLYEGISGTKYVQYHPNQKFEYLGEGETGTDTFIYTIKDSGGLIDSATVTVIIEGENDEPTAIADQLVFNEEDGVLNITAQLLANDIDVDANDIISITSIDSSSTKGLVTFNNGVVTYSPNGQFETVAPGESATDSFLYTITDPQGKTNVGTATIIIEGSPDPGIDIYFNNEDPIANDNEITIKEDDGAIDITDLILADDTDPEGDNISIIEIDVYSFADGTVTLVDGKVIYNPNGQFEDLLAGETKTDGFSRTFTYTISDGKGGTDQGNVDIIIEGQNDKPIANDDEIQITVDSWGYELLWEVEDNDTDLDSWREDDFDYIKLNTNQTKAQVYLEQDSFSKDIRYEYDNLFDYLKEGETTTDTFTYTVATQRDSYDTIAEFGTITNVTDTPQTINLTNTYENPVVLVQITSFNDPDPAVARLTEVTNNSFTVFVDEPEYLDGQHSEETISYFVIEAGSYFLPDGTFLEAGNFYSSVLVSEDFETVNFNAEFNDAPLVFSQVQTFEDTDFIKTRQQNITAEGFEVGMEKEESLANSESGFEKIGWFAIDSSEGTWDDYSYQAGNTGRIITDNFSTLNLSSHFTTIPKFFASIATYNEADAANLRYENLQSNSVYIKVEEEQSADLEINHSEEEVNFFAISGQGTLTAGNLDEDADTATVIVTIEGINDEPEAINDEIYVNEDSGEIDLTDILLSNDSDIDKDTLSITEIGVSEYADGIITLVDGRVTYNPNGQFEDLEVGETELDGSIFETFTYTISDGKGGTDEADVDILIEGENDKPIANDDTVTISEDSFGKLLFEIEDNDIDEDRFSLEYIGLDTTDTKGQVNFYEGISGTTYIQYKPNGQFDYLKQGETATDTFIYTIQDKEGETDSATVTVIIEGKNQTPNAADDSLTLVNDGNARDITSLLLENDSDVDNDTLKITAIESYSWTSGEILVNDGIVTYKPEKDDFSDSFQYTVTDDFGATSTGFVSISLTKPETEVINNPATAVDLTNITNELAEDTDTSNRIFVGDIIITDDGLGINNITLTGADANSFEVDGNQLFLKSAVELDYKTQTSYNVIINVDDATIGNTPDATTDFTLTILQEDNDTLLGDQGDDLLEGGLGDDILKGGPGNDSLYGDEGNDQLEGGLDDDRLAGGEGDDTLLGDQGNDNLFANRGDDLLEGGLDDDILKGGPGNDSLYGDEGNDQLEGGLDDDRLAGGEGDDTLLGDQGNDNLFANRGDDLLEGGLDDDILKGGPGNDSLYGDEGNDQLEGGLDDDRLAGGEGDDTLLGNQGNDNLFANRGDDLLEGGLDDDILKGGSGNDSLYGDEGNDQLEGGLDDDRLAGGEGDDTLLGDQGNDNLFGYQGDDLLEGGLGNDILNGGAGQDKFVFNSPTEGIDTIIGFSVGTDSIHVSSSGFGGGLAVGTLDANQLVLGTQATTANHRFIYNNVNGNFLFDIDGNGTTAATQIATLDTGLAMTHQDIVVFA